MSGRGGLQKDEYHPRKYNLAQVSPIGQAQYIFCVATTQFSLKFGFSLKNIKYDYPSTRLEAFRTPYYWIRIKL
jgi:hypothetical protein